MPSLTILGDSISFGQLVTSHKTWPVLLSVALERTQSEAWTVTNHSINGNTSRLGLEGVSARLSSPSPNIVMIQYGLNDCNRWASELGLSRVSEKSFKSNIEELVQRSRASGASTVFVMTSHPTLNSEHSNRSADYEIIRERYNEILREIREGDPSLRLVDIERKFQEIGKHGEPMVSFSSRLSEALLPDGIHLSEEGHDWYFRLVFDELKLSILSD